MIISERIEICGNIAAGKTTLAKAFEAELDFRCVFEDFSSVICLDDFYNNPTEYAFETECMFTLMHYYQLKEIQNGGISDFSLVDDYAFALTTLSKKEFEVYESLFDYIMESIGLPQRIVFLQSPTEVLLKRIAVRMRENEKSISKEYLENVAENIYLALKKKFSHADVINLDTSIVSFELYDKDFLKKLLG